MRKMEEKKQREGNKLSISKLVAICVNVLYTEECIYYAKQKC